jgi:hypothetical protein
MKTVSNATLRQPQSSKAGGSRFPRPANTQNARRNYERYLALARTEAQSGDRIAAENYFQHAEHYFRTMHGNSN